MLKIISANRLTDGLVVYLISEGVWTADISQAKGFVSDNEVDSALQIAKADEKRNLMLDPFAVEVEAIDNGYEPLSRRNSIRAKGPTIDYLPRQEESPRS
jgi:hypothetical protein